MIFMSSSSKQAVVIIRRIKASGRQELNLYYRLLYSLKTEQLCEQVISSGKHGIAWIGDHWTWVPKAGRAKGGEGVGSRCSLPLPQDHCLATGRTIHCIQFTTMFNL